MDQTRRSDAEFTRRRPRAAGISRQFGLIAIAAAAIAACSGVTENSDGIARLELTLPANSFIEPGVPLQLVAVALNKAGDTLATGLIWRSPDTTVTIDSTHGIVSARQASGTARIQVAAFGADTLITALGSLTLTLTAKADTLELVTADSIDVPKDAAGAALRARLAGGTPLAGVAGRPIVFRIIDPAPVDSPSVAFAGIRVVDSLASGADGAAATTLKPVTGRTAPDRVVVRITARRATGAEIPGSGRLVVVRFLHQ